VRGLIRAEGERECLSTGEFRLAGYPATIERQFGLRTTQDQ
jgi:hypothetical protein